MIVPPHPFSECPFFFGSAVSAMHPGSRSQPFDADRDDDLDCPQERSTERPTEGETKKRKVTEPDTRRETLKLDPCEHIQQPVKYVDLRLPDFKHPEPLEKCEGAVDSFANHVQSFAQPTGVSWGRGKGGKGAGMNRRLCQDDRYLTVATGSQDIVCCQGGSGDTGVFGTLFQVWANHWNLRTSPDDWWLPLITKVAQAVDDNAEAPEVRKLFVPGQEGKKDLIVSSDSWTIYDTDYSAMFSAFSKAIEKNIHVPKYVETVTSSFSTTSPAKRIASQITLMKSFQKYFDYHMMCPGCGIRGLEMVGSEEDWASLLTRLDQLRTLLRPIEKRLRLQPLFTVAEEVFTNLHRTYMDDSSMQKWWADILIKGGENEYGPSGMHPTRVDAYNGWAVEFFAGRKSIKANTLARGYYAEELSSLSACPVHIHYVWKDEETQDKATFISGVLGFHVHPQSANGVVALEPAHGWCMLLPPESPLRAPLPTLHEASP